MASKRKDALDPMATMRKEFETDSAACADKYQACIDDIEFAFIPGEQWDADMKTKRGLRPCYEFNRTAPLVKSISNDMRMNDPSIKIRSMEEGHKDLAEIFNGLLKNCEAQSRANNAYDTAGFFAAAGGFGVIKLDTQYSDDDGFEQDIRIFEVRNPFAIIFDAAAKAFDKRDSRRIWEQTEIPREEFEASYPDADPMSFNSSINDLRYWNGWATEKTVRIVKVWRRKPITKTIYQLSDGRVLDEDDYLAVEPMLNQPAMPDSGVMQHPPQPPLTLKNKRVVKSHKVTWEICSGKERLEGPNDWAGKWIPLVPVWGESVNVEGDENYQGLARRVKDPQRLHNWNVCTGMETMANQPRSPLMATSKMIEGYEEAWRNLATTNPPALFFNPDPLMPGGPRREPPPAFPAGFFEASQFASDEMKSVANVVDAPVQTRASSGKAIQAVEHQQDVGNFDYIDNLARGKAFIGEIFVDLAPKTYDTSREIMILGEDGKESYKQLNQSVYQTQDGQTLTQEQIDQAQQKGMPIPPGEWKIINDLSQGKYAVTVTVGPSFATQRMEILDAMTQLASNPIPQVALLATLGAVKNMDVPGMRDIESALHQLAVSQGLLKPAEGDQPPQPQQPSPDDQLKTAQAQKTIAEAHKLMQPTPDNPVVELQQLEIDRYNAVTERMKLGVDVVTAEKEFALDHATALHDATMQVAEHEQAPQMQGMDQAHQQQMAQMQQQHQQKIAAMKPAPNGGGQ